MRTTAFKVDRIFALSKSDKQEEMKIVKMIIGLCCISQLGAINTPNSSLALAEKKQLKQQLIKQTKTASAEKSSKNLIIQTLNPQLRINL